MKRRSFISGMIGASLGLGVASVTGAAPRVLDDTLAPALALDKHGRGYQPLLVAATAGVTGLTEAQVRSELQAGKTLTQVTESKGKTAAAVIASARTNLKTRLDQEVTSGKLSQAQADTRLADFDAQAPQLMQQVGKPINPGNPGRGRAGEPFPQLLTHATASVTGLTEAQVRTQLQAGKTLTQVAEATGKTAAAVIASARATLKTQLDQAVSAGSITQAQADTRLVDFDTQAPQLMQQTGVTDRGGRGPKPGKEKRNGTGSSTG